MRRAVKGQIEVTLLFEIAAACAALSIAVIVRVLGYFWPIPVFQPSFFKAWLWSFIVLSAVVILLNIWGFVGRVKDIKGRYGLGNL